MEGGGAGAAGGGAADGGDAGGVDGDGGAAGTALDKIGLRAAVRAANQPLARQLQRASAVGARTFLDLRRLGRDQFALVPVDVAGEQVLADQVVDVVADLVAGGVVLDGQVGKADASAGHDRVEDGPLLVGLARLHDLALGLQQEVEPHGKEGQDEEHEPQGDPGDARCLPEARPDPSQMEMPAATTTSTIPMILLCIPS